MYGPDKYSRKYKHTIAYQITADLGNYLLLVMTDTHPLLYDFTGKL